MAWSWVSFGREVPAPMASRDRPVGRTSTSGAVADSGRRGAHCGLCGVAREGMRARWSARAKKIGVVARIRRCFPNVVSGSGQLLLKSAVAVRAAKLADCTRRQGHNIMKVQYGRLIINNLLAKWFICWFHSTCHMMHFVIFCPAGGSSLAASKGSANQELRL